MVFVECRRKAGARASAEHLGSTAAWHAATAAARCAALVDVDPGAARKGAGSLPQIEQHEYRAAREITRALRAIPNITARGATADSPGIPALREPAAGATQAVARQVRADESAGPTGVSGWHCRAESRFEPARILPVHAAAGAQGHARDAAIAAAGAATRLPANMAWLASGSARCISPSN